MPVARSKRQKSSKGREKSRKLAEQIVFVAEGSGYDLHWDVEFEVDVDFHWSWKEEPRKFEWKRGDFVFVPAYTVKQHFNPDPDNEARLEAGQVGFRRTRRRAPGWSGAA